MSARRYLEVDIVSSETCIVEGRDISYKDRQKAKDSDFLDPERRSFPILSPADVAAAPHRFGTYKGKLSSEELKRRLIRKAKEKGWTSSLPKAWQDEMKNS